MSSAPQSKTVLITGCSTGIGKASVDHFLAKGWNVVATLRNPSAAPGWPASPRLLVLRLDVLDEVSMTAAVEAAISRFGAIDVLVNNAGYALAGPLEAWSPEQLRRQFETNVLGLVRMTQFVLPHMRSRRQGTIVNVSSIGGRMTFPLFGAYHGTKWAVEAISEAARYELAQFGIRLKVIEPGGTKTDFISRGMTVADHPAYPNIGDHLIAFGRRIDPLQPRVERVAHAIYKAATSRSRRLRYPINGLPILLLHALLPGRLWWWLVATLMLPKGQRG